MGRRLGLVSKKIHWVLVGFIQLMLGKHTEQADMGPKGANFGTWDLVQHVKNKESESQGGRSA